MKSLPTGLQSFLDSGSTTMAYCWRVTREDGVIQGFTEHDRNLTFDGTDFLASSGFTASQIESSLGLSVDNLNVQSALSSDTINEDDLGAGRYDNALVELFWVNFEDVVQRILMTKGNLGSVKRQETSFNVELRSQSARLNQKVGRVYQKDCDALLGDDRCQKALGSVTSTGTVTSTNGPRLLIVSGLSNNTDDFYAYGKITFTSGDCDGLTFEVKRHEVNGAVTLIELWTEPPYSIGALTTFSVVAGCDKSLATCKAKFNNVINFQGFPYIPGNDALAKYARSGQGGSGESLFGN